MADQIDWKARAERAEAACAEAHNILKLLLKRIVPLAHTEGLHLAPKCPACKVINLINHALSTSCGKDYVRREELDAAKAELAKLRSRIRCIYCNAEYSHDQANELADHILSCKKSPLVQLNKEIQSKAIDLMDLTRDEFIRIAAISDNSEIQGICARSQEIIEQKYPVIKQRDEALDKLRLSEAQVVKLLDENNSLKLDYSHSECEANASKAEVERLSKKLHAVKATLAYVAYARLPLGNTVFDTLQENWQREVIKAIDIESEQALAGKEGE